MRTLIVQELCHGQSDLTIINQPTQDDYNTEAQIFKMAAMGFSEEVTNKMKENAVITLTADNQVLRNYTKTIII